MMRIWIDGQCLQTGSRERGIGRYVTELVHTIAQEHADVELLVSLNAGMPYEAIAARDLLRRWLPRENIHLWTGIAEGGEAVTGNTEGRRLSELAIAWHVESLGVDWAISASPFEGSRDAAVPLLPTPCFRTPVASIFYDAIPYRYPDQYLISQTEREYYYRRIETVGASTLLLCISEFGVTETRNLFPEIESFNISAGVNGHLHDATSTLADSAIQELSPFVLHVGVIDWRKNVVAAIQAFALLPDVLRLNTRFVLAGPSPETLLQPLVSLWERLGLPRQNLVTLGPVSEGMLTALYRACRVLIHPSLMEGFGLTALEAMKCGTPVLASRAGALAEVVGDEAFLFDPRDPSEIARLLERVLGDEDFRSRALAHIRMQAQKFSWSETARRLVDALRAGTRGDRTTGGTAALAALRSSYVQAARPIELPIEQKVRVFANAEAADEASPRTLIDVTSTVQNDHGTGIQRVVREMAAGAIGGERSEQPPRFLMWCESKWWQNALVDPQTKRLTRDEDHTSAIEFRAGDRIVMLDSSWLFHGVHLPTLLAARLRGAEVVTCLYDTVPLRQPGMTAPPMPWAFSAWLKSTLIWSTGFICISRAVADELLAMLRAMKFPREMQVGYWHLGADFAAAPQRDLSARAVAGRTRFLMVGTLEPRKGHKVVLDAFDRLWAEGLDVELTIVGKPGWGTGALVERLHRHAEKGRRLHWLQRADDAELAVHYGSCDALIAASHAEGFGLPIVEAAHFGKPVIASDIPVFREVTARGQACIFFEPGSSRALAGAIESFVSDGPPTHADGRASTLSWAESASQFFDVVEGGKWYATYRPEDADPFVPLHHLGTVAMERALAENERAHRIALVDGPVFDAQTEQVDYLLKVTNCSEHVWSSLGRGDGSLAITLGYHVLGKNGSMLEPGGPRVPIPFLHLPHDSHHVTLSVPANWLAQGATHIDVEMVQEGVAWWGNALRLPLQ